MSLEQEDQHGLNQHAEMDHASEKELRISYTRDFLLSLSELDVCKKLPSGFDQSLLSEFEYTPQDRFKISGGLSSQSFRRNEYGSSPPTRGDISNYSRGIHGRWDSRSSGRSDQDSDSQSDRDSDSGRRYGNQSRRPWQVMEHDGLLGSGSFPRPPGYTSGASAPKFRANDFHQLSRSNEPYHPPRPYKAVPHSRRDTNDSYNDETFGSSEYTSEDRAEEERKRRASFELMRKEQQKAFQEKLKLNTEKSKNDFNISLLLEDSKDDKGLLDRSNASDEPVVCPSSNNEADKSFLPPSAPVSRPLVPPGFSSTIASKNIGTKLLTHPLPSEDDNDFDGSLLNAKGNRVLNETSKNQDEKRNVEQMDLSEQQHGSPSINVLVNNSVAKTPNISSTMDVASKKTDMDSQFYKTAKLLEAFQASENCEIAEPDASDMKENKVMGESSSEHPTSILEKLFGSALTLNGSGSSSFIENHDVKADDMMSPDSVQSSKFAQWFLDEEKKPVDDLPTGRPNDLLSLIVGGEKGGSQIFYPEANEHIPPNFPIQSSGLADRRVTSNLMSAKFENTEQLSTTDKSEAAPAVLTCEDLEQSILSEISEKGSTFQPLVLGRSDSDTKTQQQKADIDDCASQHILSLLQKGKGPNDMAPLAKLGIRSSDNLQSPEAADFGSAPPNSREADAENIPNSGKPLTLEALFGTAFMKELQPAGGQASGQRDSIGSARVDVSESHGLPFSVMDDDRLATTVETASNMTGYGSVALSSKERQQMKLDRIEKHLLSFDPQNEVDSSQLQAELGSKFGGFDGSAEIRLPEEDSLITVSDPPHLQNFILARNSSKAELLSTAETPVNIAEKLVALKSVFRDERPLVGGQEGPPFLRGPYEMREPDFQYHNLHVQPSSPQHFPQLNPAGPVFHHLDSHPANANAQMKFISPDNIIHHDSPNHPYPASMLRPPFHHHSTGLTGLDPTTHNPMLQQMQMPGNFPPSQLLRGFPRGAPIPPHPNNPVTGFMQEPSPMQGFPFGQRQPNFGGLGIPPQASDAGSGANHPEALQRLIEMELRSSSKPIHPFATVGPSPGLYGHELDMGFGYR